MIPIEFKETPLNVEICEKVSFYSFSLSGKAEDVCATFTIPGENAATSGMKYFFALHVPYIWWMIPAYGTTARELPPFTQMLLCRLTDGSYQLFLPLIDTDVRGTLRGGKEKNEFELYYQGTLENAPQKQACLLAVASGGNPYELMHHAMRVIRDRMGTFELRENKAFPEFLKQIGWCTWDSCQQNVNAEKVLAGLESFKQAGFVPNYLILDDGWLSVSKPGSKLLMFQANPKKFPQGLKPLIQETKEKYGVREFAVWHTLQGYWQGIVPSPFLPYQTVENAVPVDAGCVEPCIDNGCKSKAIPPHYDLYLIAPSDIGQFYDDFYSFLKSEGVGMTKIDNQCATAQLFSAGKLPRVTTSKAYSVASQNAAEKHFDNNTIHCMCNSNEMYFNMKKGNVWRNSDDNAPLAPLSRQQWNLHCNAKAAFLASIFSWPDWDMIQSTQVIAEAQTAARAISGGPVYLSDGATKHDMDVIGKLIDGNGDLLRPDLPALPTEDILFVNVERDHFPLKIMNKCGEAGILALFNCCTVEPDYIFAEYRMSDNIHLKADDLAVYSMKSKTIRRLKRTDAVMERLTVNEYEILTAAPIVNGFAAIGLENKYVPAAIFTEVKHDTGLTVQARCGGTFLFYAEKEPKSVLVNGQETEFQFKDNLVRVEIASKKPVAISLN